MTDPIPDNVPDEAELLPARELLDRAITYKADAEHTRSTVDAFVAEITKGARDKRERYRFFAHAYALVKKHRDVIAAEAREERESLLARSRTEKKRAALEG